MKRLLIAFVGALLLLSALNYLTLRQVRPVAATTSKPRPTSVTQIERLPPVVFDHSDSNQVSGSRPAPEKPVAEKPVEPGSTKQTTRANASNSTKAPAKDPMARAALGDVGLDADAEEYWIMAINDPTLSANERQDLIEDLNEDGFDDPDNPGAADIPLILSRIQIVEENAPFAMDDVNRAAFAEAYKDLLNMFAKATGN